MNPVILSVAKESLHSPPLLTEIANYAFSAQPNETLTPSPKLRVSQWRKLRNAWTLERAKRRVDLERSKSASRGPLRTSPQVSIENAGAFSLNLHGAAFGRTIASLWG